VVRTSSITKLSLEFGGAGTSSLNQFSEVYRYKAATVYKDKAKIWHGRVYHGVTQANLGVKCGYPAGDAATAGR